MARATPPYADDEAKKEVLATIHAARELGPEMDSALAERCAQQLASLYPEMAPRTQQTQATLRTLLASLRGSDPAGDEALASDYLTRLRAVPPPQAITPGQAYGAPGGYGPYGPNPYGPYGPNPYGPPMPYGPPGPPRAPGPAAYIPLIVTAAVVIAAVSFGGIHFLWLIWLIPFWGLFGRGMRRSRYNRRYYRDQRRQARWDYRNRMRGPNGSPPLPPNGPEIL